MVLVGESVHIDDACYVECEVYSDHRQNADHHDNNIQENYCVHDDMNVDVDVQFETECVSMGVELMDQCVSEVVGQWVLSFSEVFFCERVVSENSLACRPFSENHDVHDRV